MSHSHQSPVPSPQSPVPSHQSPVPRHKKAVSKLMFTYRRIFKLLSSKRALN
ncbi:hypothetical protein [Sphaerospermopsis sp. FACHB-1194]|uniref:hypothetical protein n=1 Tax=Sphaerospermopsis sp. FACHB-1194 TaxID=2692862 RepID=UPI0016808D11|nr:hypothetical protein [Sphaerospermopsis sp. FACHB-1194]MBD2145638.1 hypothetical protein [Sphaerospermopsis sp. FACHB-1194]